MSDTAILSLRIRGILLADGVYSAESHHPAKFRIKLANPFEILQFFEFSRWRLSAILYLLGTHFNHPRWVLGDLYHYAKLGYNRCSSFDNMNVSIFGGFGWKTPIHAPKIVVFGLFDTLMGCNINESQKRHTLAWVRIIWAMNHEIWWAVWPVGELLIKMFGYITPMCPEAPPMDDFPPNFAQL